MCETWFYALTVRSRKLILARVAWRRIMCQNLDEACCVVFVCHLSMFEISNVLWRILNKSSSSVAYLDFARAPVVVSNPYPRQWGILSKNMCSLCSLDIVSWSSTGSDRWRGLMACPQQLLDFAWWLLRKLSRVAWWLCQHSEDFMKCRLLEETLSCVTASALGRARVDLRSATMTTVHRRRHHCLRDSLY